MKFLLILLVCVSTAFSAAKEDAIIAALIDPVKLSTLPTDGRRMANDRLLKVMAHLRIAHMASENPHIVIRRALQINNQTGTHSEMVYGRLIENYKICDEKRLFTASNIENMKRGKSPVLQSGEIMEVDHIIPLSKYPEYENEMINLRLVPESANLAKRDEMVIEAQQLLDLLKSMGAAQSAPHDSGNKFTYKRHLVESGKSINLRSFGGEDTDLVIHSEDIGSINVTAQFNENMVTRTLPNTNRVVTQPDAVKTQLRKNTLRKIEKSVFDGDLFEIYRDRTGIIVFYNDSTFTPINKHELVLEIPNN